MMITITRSSNTLTLDYGYDSFSEDMSTTGLKMDINSIFVYFKNLKRNFEITLSQVSGYTSLEDLFAYMSTAPVVPVVESIPQWVLDKCLMAFDDSQACSGVIRNLCDNGATVMTYTGSGLDRLYYCPDNATYKAADTGYVFFKSDGSISQCDGNRLIAYDFPTVWVKYANASPYAIQWVAIPKLGETFTTAQMDFIRDLFDLSIWWSGVLSLHGNYKGNKPLAQKYAWTPESVEEAETTALCAAFPTPATAGLRTLIDTCIRDLKAGGYLQRLDTLQCYRTLAADQSYFNWKTALSQMTIGGTGETFTAKVGWRDATGAGYIKTGFVPSAGVKYTKNACIWGMECTTFVADSSWQGCMDPTVANRLNFRMNQDYPLINQANTGVAIARAFAVGFWANTRRNSTDWDAFVVDTWQARSEGGAFSSTDRPPVEVYLNAYNISDAPGGIGTNGFGWFYAGDQFSRVEHDAIVVILKAFNTGVALL
jgi:hypothetical protein